MTPPIALDVASALVQWKSLGCQPAKHHSSQVADNRNRVGGVMTPPYAVSQQKNNFHYYWAVPVEGPKGCVTTAWLRDALSAATGRLHQGSKQPQDVLPCPQHCATSGPVGFRDLPALGEGSLKI